MSLIPRLGALLALFLLTACAPSLHVMSFNVRYPSDQGPQPWAVRRPVMVNLIREARPDLIGTQELFQRQGDDLVRALPGYRWFGRDRRGEHADEHMGIFYRPDRLRLVHSGDFWLSDTPEQPGSMSWGTDLPRLASWGIFDTRGARPHRFLFIDTHLAHREQDAAARARAAALIVGQLPVLAGDLPIILAGDMNARPDSGAYRAFVAALADAREHAARRRGPKMTFHDFTGVPDRRIDYLFTRGFAVIAAETHTYHQGSVYPSDHFPVSATLRFTSDRRPN
ncbi:endonuclease/exonuclease/phosphatase family protein [Sphingomonas xinjiangensis]|uniref:Endonuclease/exonuclease/phosphatase family metal-dependent hydrolase n=1 Tax=Sphingomonas xinjiangensis TaxID=643568 RepID=A0A840YFB6_9SPHN|nr:endonuclease/exonuclease/phosphatase family protein [Sphingomonas xinjiangensis]MBB5710995.1 endonuclease/exonuclease/phosphatase family metal-dependent hydrolase [Sphingomonas xinjiangensis]